MGNRFYQVCYFKLNTPELAFWARLTFLHSRSKFNTGETWAIAFVKSENEIQHMAAKESFSLREPPQNFDEIGSCVWGPDFTRGNVRSGNNEIMWNLKFTPNSRGFEHMPHVLKTLRLVKAQASTPNPDLRFTGTVTVNGRAFQCVAAPGMQGRISGSKLPEKWAWAHCNGGDFVFEALSASPKIGGVVAVPLMSVFYLKFEDQELVVNSTRKMFFRPSKFSLSGWEFEFAHGKFKVRGAITAQIGEFAGIQYDDPDGSTRFCHNSKVSHIRIEIFENEKLVKNLSSRDCAFEVVTRNQDSRVRRLL